MNHEPFEHPSRAAGRRPRAWPRPLRRAATLALALLLGGLVVLLFFITIAKITAGMGR